MMSAAREVIRGWFARDSASPLRPTLGEFDVPPAVWRKLKQLRELLKDPNRNKRRVYELQMSLAKGGWEVPTSYEDIGVIEKRLRERLRAFEAGMR